MTGDLRQKAPTFIAGPTPCHALPLRADALEFLLAGAFFRSNEFAMDRLVFFGKNQKNRNTEEPDIRGIRYGTCRPLAEFTPSNPRRTI
jgi:hypothetical protein